MDKINVMITKISIVVMLILFFTILSSVVTDDKPILESLFHALCEAEYEEGDCTDLWNGYGDSP